MLITSKDISLLKKLIILSIFESFLLLFYIIYTNIVTNNRFIPLPSEILMILFAVVLLSFFVFFLSSIFTGKYLKSIKKQIEKVIQFEGVTTYQEICFILVFNVGILSILLLVGASNIYDFLGEKIFLRLKQYYPIIFLCGVLVAQLLYWRSHLEAFPQKKFSFSNWLENCNKWVIVTILFTTSFCLYFSTSMLLGQMYTPKPAHFPELAEAFLNGRMYLIDPLSTKDLSLFDGKYYVSFPPLAAILMLPIVAISGFEGINTTFWNTMIGSTGVIFIFLALDELRVNNWSCLSKKDNILLAFFMGFCTVQYAMSIRGTVYYISQLLTSSFLALSFWVALIKIPAGEIRKQNLHALLVGLFLGASVLARPNVIFVVIALIAIQYQKILEEHEDSPLRKISGWSFYFSIPIIIVLLILAVYNHVRFNSFFDFGYKYMLVVDKSLIFNLENYGQFHPVFIFGNFYDNFLRLPYWDRNCNILTPDPNGLSIFIISPLIIFLYRSFKLKPWIVGMWCSVFLILMTHLLYFNSGAIQFGYRFSLDFVPLIVLLLGYTLKEGLEKIGYILISYGFCINVIGAIWIARRWCENW